VYPLILALALTKCLGGESLATNINRYLKPFVEEGQISGTLLVARNDQILFETSLGMANYELRVPNSVATRFNVASITKELTLIALIQEIEAKSLNVDAALKTFIPDFPGGDKITILDLLNHESGIPHSVTDDADECNYQTAQSMVALISKSPKLFAPKTREVYSSAGYSVLARVLEVLDKAPYDDIIRKRILDPVGMHNTSSAVSDFFIPDRAESYIRTPNALWPCQPKDYSFLVGAGCHYSTCRDLFKLLRYIVDGKLGATVKENLVRGPQSFWNGLTNGSRAFVQYDVSDGVTVIYCGNTVTGAADTLRQAIPKIVRGEHVAPAARIEPKTFPLSEMQTAEYVGTYKISTTDESFKMTARNGLLILGDTVLVPTAPAHFFAMRDYGELTTVRDPEGRVSKLDWHEDGKVVMSLIPLDIRSPVKAG